MSFYKWSKKLLVRSEFLTDEDKRRGIKKKFAVAEACCCPQWYCVLTEDGEYECRDKSPDPDENAQVLSEHKDETACQKECYERYYCINVNGDYQCKKEGDVKDDDDIVGGPYPEDECETECVNCPPCGNEACEADSAGDNDILAQCCASLTDDEEWTYDEDAAEWSITRHCGDNKNTPCRGDDAAGFPDSPQDGDTVNFPCVPNGTVPEDLPDCKKCLFDCDKDAEPPECIPAPDTGQYAKKECEKECAGLWYCTSTSKCERQNPPKNPAKKGYETEGECVAAAPTECALPPGGCCAVCEEPLVEGACLPGFSERDGKCVKEIDYNCDPDVLDEITFDYPECQNGFQSNSGPCPPPPPPPPCGDCVPIPGITDLKVEVSGEPGKEQVCVLATAQWTPPDGCYESDQEARDKVNITFEFLDKDREVIQSIGGPANIGENIVGYCNSLDSACDPSSKKADAVRAKAVSDECESKWSRAFALPGGSATWEEICTPPPPECSDDNECGAWYIDIYDGTNGDHPECDAEPDGGPFPTVSEAQAWSQANTPEQCYSTMNGSPDPDLACRDGQCVPKDNPLP